MAAANDELKLIVQTIYEKKGYNIITIDVTGISSVTDFLIIAEGSVDRHVKAIGEAVIQSAEKVGIEVIRTEGSQYGDWFVLDFGEFMVHLFTPELREKYAIERVWSAGKILEIYPEGP
ncbi:MAG: hypothetical protein Tsb0021_05490 [Chlamydiales bacterium]